MDQEQYVPTPTPNIFSKLKAVLVRNKFLIIVIVVVSSLSLSTTGYLLMANKKTEIASQAASPEQSLGIPTIMPTVKPTIGIPTSTPIPTQAASQAATLNAYSSSKYSYSLKYPLDWTAKVTTQSDPKILEYVVFNPKTATSSATPSISLSYGTRTYAEALAIDSQIGEALIVASASTTKKNKKDSDGNESISVIIPTGTRTIMMYSQKKYSTTLDQMLATLKLTK